jgi:class 3 adenylate cyclase
MESNYISYDFEKSRNRIDVILNTNDANFEEVNEIPSRDKLTYSNGFYVNCSSMFVDIRKSTELTTKYNRPTLAKIYRTFISEVVAVVNGNSNCSEIFIQGDCVWAVFNTPYKAQIDSVFSTAARVSSIVDTMNCKFKKKNIDTIDVGIGIDYGRALMIQAGYSGSGINDVVWMGDVVNHAAKLARYGNKTWYDMEFMVSSVFYENLNEISQKLLSYNNNRQCYHGNVINLFMNDWITENYK